MTGIAVPGMDSYEDMFKEITRKLYGEEDMENSEAMRVMQEYDGETFKMDEAHNSLTAFGLAALMQNGFSTPTLLSTHVQMDTSSDKLKQDEDQWISSEEVLPWTQSKIASYNAAQKLFRCNECECVGFLSRVAEHWLGTHANLRVFQCPQCPYASAWARCVRMHLARQHNVCPDQNPDSLSTLWKENPVLEEVTKFLQRLKTKVESEATATVSIKIEPQEFPNTTTQTTQTSVTSAAPTLVSTVPQQPVQQPPSQATTPQQQSRSSSNEQTTSTSPKRYNCSYCHYKTDRRDLYTRHENIHRDEKPFHCYVCQKQFNRADHVKKHFLRMHRDQPYDINRIRRTISKESNPLPPPPTPTTFYPTKSVEQVQQPQSLPPNMQHQQQQTEPVHININIPGYTQRSSSDEKKSRQKKPGEKRYSCCYCSWSGVDNWCLKRHLNTHLKPFVCSLCEYKAARSERLATHVFKVHNKRACSRCSFLADDQAQLSLHQQQQHQEENALRRKRPGQERYACRYCSWAGIDNWGLKRHLNTHLKPFVCGFCDYKAARSERLATHVLTVHNRTMCSHCNFNTDNQSELVAHQQQHHHHINSNSSTSNKSNTVSLQNTLHCPPLLPLTVIADNSNNSYVTKPSSDIEATTVPPPLPPLKPIKDMIDSAQANGGKLKSTPVALLMNKFHLNTSATLKRSASLEIIQCAEGSSESEQKFPDHDDDNSNIQFGKETTQKNYRCGICCLQTETQEAMLLHLNFHSPNNFNLNMTTDEDDQLEIIPLQTIITEETNDDYKSQASGELMDNNNETESKNKIYRVISRKFNRNFSYVRKCGLCSKNAADISMFNGPVNYAIHLLNCHTKNKIVCKWCKTKFRHKYQLSLHRKLYKCKKLKLSNNNNNNINKKDRITLTTTTSLFLKTDDGFKFNNNNNSNNNNNNNNKCKRLNELIIKCSRRLQKI